MEIQVGLWEFLAGQAALIGMLGGVLLKVGHVLLGSVIAQFEKRLEERFRAQDQAHSSAGAHWESRFNEMERSLRGLERSHAATKEEMLRDYTRREDSIRDQTVTQAKLDALGARIELLTRIIAGKESA